MAVTYPYTQAQPKTGRLSYRRAIPEELRPHIPRNPRELKRSLGAKRIDDSGAMARYQAAHVEYEAITSKARKQLTGSFDTLDPPKIIHLAAVFEYEWLAADEATRISIATLTSYLERGEDGLFTAYNLLAQSFNFDLASAPRSSALNQG